MSFAHLHVHSYYSLMDGFNSPEELILRAKELGQPGIAFTDHGSLSVWREAQAAGEKHGIKVVLGVEAYISPTDRFDKSSGTDKSVLAYHHVILLAKNDVGLNNIRKLSEIGWTEGYYNKPRIDREVLDQYGEGLIVLSGCMSGLIAKNFLNGNDDMAKSWAKWFHKRFGGDFYMELQYHNEDGLNEKMVHLAEEIGIECVVTSDCHFARPEERADEEAMLILSTSPKKNKDFDFAKSREFDNVFDRLNYIYPDRPISFEKIDVYVQPVDEIVAGMMENLKKFSRVNAEHVTASAVENTLRVLDKVEGYTYQSGLDLLPRPKNDDPAVILRKRVMVGMKRRGLDKNKEALARMNYELKAMNDKGVNSYHLIVSESTDFARENDIMVGPGRGSAAGSIVCYALGITDIDPLEYKLEFTRYINPGFVKPFRPRLEVV